MISRNMKKLRANIVHLQIDEEIWKKAFIDPESYRELQVGSAGPFSEKNKWFLSPGINTDHATHCLGHDS